MKVRTNKKTKQHLQLGRIHSRYLPVDYPRFIRLIREVLEERSKLKHKEVNFED